VLGTHHDNVSSDGFHGVSIYNNGFQGCYRPKGIRKTATEGNLIKMVKFITVCNTSLQIQDGVNTLYDIMLPQCTMYLKELNFVFRHVGQTNVNILFKRNQLIFALIKFSYKNNNFYDNFYTKIATFYRSLI